MSDLTDPSKAPSSSGEHAPQTASGSILKDTTEFFRDYSHAPAPLNFVYTHCTQMYLDGIDVDNPPSSALIEQQLLALTNTVIKNENLKCGKGDTRYPQTKHLSSWQVAQILLKLHHVIRIAPSAGSYDREYDVLSMYVSDGVDKGLHTPSEDEIRMCARHYNAALTLADFKEVVAVLREAAPRRQRSTEPDLVPVNNGVVYYGRTDRTMTINGKEFGFRAKSLHPFDPELIFLCKTGINLRMNAQNPAIVMPDGTEWDVATWIKELFDEEGQEGLEELIWEILGAIVRPYVRWNKTAWLYSEKGNNGKGTLCSLMRNLVGERGHTSIPLSELGKDFALEPVLKANAIIVDENDVGTYIDKAANLKTIVTNDVIQINRKYRMPIAFQFFGLMVQCLNEMPRVKDKSESFYRRQLFVPFRKTFTGAERRYIKDDYLKRHEVLEYILKRVLIDTDFYEFSEPVATKEVLAEYKEHNDPVRAYWADVREQLTWDLVPFVFLYDLYKAWFARFSPSGQPVAYKVFIKDLCNVVEDDELFHCRDKNPKIRTSILMREPEPLIAEYDLANWMNTSYKGSDPVQRSRFTNPQPNYRGLLRRPQAPSTTSGGSGATKEAA